MFKKCTIWVPYSWGLPWLATIFLAHTDPKESPKIQNEKLKNLDLELDLNSKPEPVPGDYEPVPGDYEYEPGDYEEGGNGEDLRPKEGGQVENPNTMGLLVRYLNEFDESTYPFLKAKVSVATKRHLRCVQNSPFTFLFSPSPSPPSPPSLPNCILRFFEALEFFLRSGR